MFQKLEAVENRYEELNKKIADPEVIANTSEWTKFMKEHAEIEEVALKYKEYKQVQQSIEEAQEMLNDPEMRELAEEELYENKEKLPKIEEELKILLIPKDPDDDKNIICEIRAGAGGDEAALFAGTLYRMYSMYAERKHWKMEVLNENETICKERGILFEYEININIPLKMNSVVVCSIFSNLLKNAVAGAIEALNDDKRPYVNVKAYADAVYLHVIVQNSYKAGEDKKRKGYGQEILRSLAEKYDGQMEIKKEKGMYEVSISVKLEE